MRKFLIVPLVAVVVGFVLMAAYAEERDQHRRHPKERKDAEEREQHKGRCREWKKDAKVEVTNIENGAIITITSDNPEVVTLIQEYAARKMEKGKHDSCKCEDKKDSTPCKCDCDKEKGSTECEKPRGGRCR